MLPTERPLGRVLGIPGDRLISVTHKFDARPSLAPRCCAQEGLWYCFPSLAYLPLGRRTGRLRPTSGQPPWAGFPSPIGVFSRPGNPKAHVARGGSNHLNPSTHWADLLRNTSERAIRYIDSLRERPVAPRPAAVEGLRHLRGPLPSQPTDPARVLELLD